MVFQRDEELRLAGVALATGATTKLVVDAARLVPLGAEDVEAAEGADLLRLLLPLLVGEGKGRGGALLAAAAVARQAVAVLVGARRRPP